MDVLRCIILPIEGRDLILPYAAVAEVVNFEEPKPIQQAPLWLLGNLPWRKMEIPLVSLEKMDGSKETASKKNALVAILNRTSDKDKFEFLGLILRTLPRMTRIRSGDIKYVAKGSKFYELMEVMVRDEKAVIPNLKWIEEAFNTSIKK